MYVCVCVKESFWLGMCFIHMRAKRCNRHIKQIPNKLSLNDAEATYVLKIHFMQYQNLPSCQWIEWASHFSTIQSVVLVVYSMKHKS